MSPDQQRGIASDGSGEFPATGGPVGSPSEREGHGAWSEDLRLTRLCIQGDPAATREFTQRMSCIPRFLQRLSTDDPRSLRALDVTDVAQEAARRVWARREHFDGRARLTTWCCGIAHFTYLEERRRVTRRLDREEDCPAETLLEEPAPDDVADAVVERFEVARLRRAIEALPAADRDLLRGRLYHGMSFAELGKENGLTGPAAKARYYRLLRRIKDRLKGRDTA